MSIFRRNWNKPGPGVEKDEPRKKGLRRFWEVLTRDLADLIKLSGLVFLCCLPAIAAFVLLLLGPLGVLVPLLLMAPAALPVGGALCAMCYCLSQMLQDEPAFLWHDFKRKFKENFASAAIPGIICALLITAHSYSLFLYLLGGLAGSPAWMPAVWLFSVLLFAMVCPYYFLQAVYLDLGPTALLKNSLILAFAHLPRSAMGALMGGILWVAFVLLFPLSLLAAPLIPLIGCSLSCLLGMFWTWPVVDGRFKIEETLRARKDAKD